MTLPQWFWNLMYCGLWDDDGGGPVRAVIVWGDPVTPGLGHGAPFDSLHD